MKKDVVNIDFKKMAQAMREAVREKAIQFGNTIVYLKAGKLVEENPQTNQMRTLERTYNV